MLPLNETTYGVLRLGRKALAEAWSNTSGVSGKTGAPGGAGEAGRFLKSVPRVNWVPAFWVRSRVPPKLAPTILDVRFKPSRAKAIDQPPRITVWPDSPVNVRRKPLLKFG